MASFVRLNQAKKVDGKMRNAGDVVKLPSSMVTAYCRPGSGIATRLNAGELKAAKAEAAKARAEKRMAHEKAKAAAKKKADKGAAAK